MRVGGAVLETAPGLVSEAAAGVLVPAALLVRGAGNAIAGLFLPNAGKFVLGPFLAGFWAIRVADWGNAVAKVFVPGQSFLAVILTNHRLAIAVAICNRVGVTVVAVVAAVATVVTAAIAWIRTGSIPSAIAVILIPNTVRSAIVVLGTPVERHTVVGIFVVVVVFVAFAVVGVYKIFRRDHLIEEIHTLAEMTGIEGLSSRTALFTILSLLALAGAPVER